MTATLGSWIDGFAECDKNVSEVGLLHHGIAPYLLVHRLAGNHFAIGFDEQGPALLSLPGQFDWSSPYHQNLRSRIPGTATYRQEPPLLNWCHMFSTIYRLPGGQSRGIIGFHDSSRRNVEIGASAPTYHRKEQHHLNEVYDDDAHAGGPGESGRREHVVAAVRAHLYEMAGNVAAAIDSYLAAANGTSNVAERNFLLAQAARIRS